MLKSDSDASRGETVQDLILECVKIGVSEGWGDALAKWKGGTQTLLVHGWNAASLTRDIMDLVGGFSQESKKIGVIASFFHDYGKAEGQHDQLSEKRLREILAPLNLSEDEMKEVFTVIAKVENPVTPNRFFTQISVRQEGDRRVPDVCRLADQLLVIRSLTKLELTKGAEELLDNFSLDIEYHLVSPVRGVSTQILHRTLEDYYVEKAFKPVLFFPEGTLYLGRGEIEPPQREALLHALKKKFDAFFKENPAFQQGGRAFGNWTATLVTDVIFALSSDSSIRSFWNTVYNKPIITGWLSKERTPEAHYQAIFYMFYALKALVTSLAEKIKESEDSERLYSELQKSLEEKLGLDAPLSRTILTISHTTKNEEKKQLGVKILDTALSHLQVKDKSPEASLEILRDKLVEVSRRLSSKYIPSIERAPKRVLEELLDDVGRPLLQDVEKQISECWEAFLTGKKRRGTPVCCFCARPAEKVASSSTFGKGAESFSNLLAGGSIITGSNKSQVCLLCEFEENLRRALRGNYEEVIYIFPQVNLSRSMWDTWNETSQTLLKGASSIAVELNPLSQYVYWSRFVIKGNRPEQLDALKTFYDVARYERAWVEQLARQLKENWEDLEHLKSWVPEEIKDFNELAEAILAGKVKVPPAYEENLASDLLEGARINLASNPNFIVVLTDSSSLKVVRDESETSLALRKLFVGLLLSKLLHSSVIFPTLKQESMMPVETRGAVYEAQKTGLKKVFKIIGVENGWVPFPQSSFALKYLVALILCEKRLRDVGADMGKDTLVKLPSLIPGQILNRYLQTDKRETDMEFFTLLDVLEENRCKAGFVGK